MDKADQENLSKTKDPKGFLVEKAKAIGLNVDQFKKDEDSQNVKDQYVNLGPGRDLLKLY